VFFFLSFLANTIFSSRLCYGQQLRVQNFSFEKASQIILKVLSQPKMIPYSSSIEKKYQNSAHFSTITLQPYKLQTLKWSTITMEVLLQSHWSNSQPSHSHMAIILETIQAAPFEAIQPTVFVITCNSLYNLFKYHFHSK
jgi:hypothetical protein